MHIFKSLFIAFAMYSKIPAPHVEWSEKNMKYAICWFPLIGVVIGAVSWLWMFVSGLLGLSKLLYACVAAVIPTLITGGIHMDGFCDTTDAISSWQTRERRLEILKDSNAGAFAVIKTAVYYVLYVGAFSALSAKSVLIVAVGFALSRSLSGFSVVNFKGATASGTAAAFRDASKKKTCTVVLTVWVLAVASVMVIFGEAVGMICVVLALSCFVYYRVMSYRNFGGITGDLAGYFLSLCELWIALGAVLGEAVQRFIG